MRIVLASSEAAPFSKTGGLADVAAALPKVLARAGHDVSLFIPHYPARTAASEIAVEPLDLSVDVNIGTRRVSARILRADLPRSRGAVFLIDQPLYFDRPGLYQVDGQDFPDNCERFVFFSRAVMEAVASLDLRPQIVHANDWQTGLMPALVQAEYARQPGFAETASVFTIHNLAFQGHFWHWDMLLTGLDWKYFNWKQMEYFGHLNLLKTGVVFADMVTTVSPNYAREIQTAEYGCGLDGVLRSHSQKLVGILNGIDTEVWNPETDSEIRCNYGIDDVEAGKAECKRALQERMGLPLRNDVPLLACISRLTEQKGFDLVDACLERVLESDVQFVILGTGDGHFERRFRDLSRQLPDKLVAVIGFDEKLAHRIEAGADAFVMPSRFEPSGLNQMYSLAYGTVPVVRTVGGLADSVVDATDENLRNATANGFRFDDYNADQLCARIHRAIELYRDKPTWMQLVRNGMRRDWSWENSAVKYLDVYKRALENRAAAGRPGG